MLVHYVCSLFYWWCQFCPIGQSYPTPRIPSLSPELPHNWNNPIRVSGVGYNDFDLFPENAESIPLKDPKSNSMTNLWQLFFLFSNHFVHVFQKVPIKPHKKFFTNIQYGSKKTQNFLPWFRIREKVGRKVTKKMLEGKKQQNSFNFTLVTLL
jgi:hypothetical protein